MGRGPIIYEHETSYLEIDPDRVIALSQYTFTFTDLNRTADAYIHRDFGAGFFTDYTEYFEFQVSGADDLARVFVYGKSNSIHDFYYLYSTDQRFISVLAYDNSYILYLWQHEPYFGLHQDLWAGMNVSTPYYCQLVKSGTSYTLYVRTGSHTGSLQATLTIVGESQSYRYHFIVNNWNSNVANKTIDGFSRNHDLQLQSVVPHVMHHRQQQGAV